MRILVAEISGKRPGTSDQRPTEKLKITYDHVIISNNADGYVTDWPVVMVPDDYSEWYKNSVRTGEKSWYAPMNRSYAIKYAKEHGYDVLVQMDDNIIALEVAYMTKEDDDGIRKRYRSANREGLADDFIGMLACALEHTNAAMAGCNLISTVPTADFIRERYVYSFFALKLSCCPDIFHGDFEDDIEYRLKCAEMGLPVIMVAPLRYGKVSQKKTGDVTGCRAAYAEAGISRGANMSVIHGDMYSHGYAKKTISTMSKADGSKVFKHKIRPFKLGILADGDEAMERRMLEVLSKYAEDRPDRAILKERR